MTQISRIRTALTGFPGAPGVITMYALDAGVFVADLENFWTTAGTLFMADVTLQVENAGDIIDDTTGVITGAWTSGVFPVSHGTGTGNYAAPAGVLIEWMTSTILDGRRIRGKSFIVPVGLPNFTPAGQVDASVVANLTANGVTLVTGTPGNMVIWHRPRKARAATATLPARAARPGGHALVTGVRVSPKVTVLRSRRD